MNVTTRDGDVSWTDAGEAAPPMALGIGTLAILVGAAYLLFIVGPPLLAAPVESLPSLRTGDLVDLVTPLVVIPLAGADILKLDLDRRRSAKPSWNSGSSFTASGPAGGTL